MKKKTLTLGFLIMLALGCTKIAQQQISMQQASSMSPGTISTQ